MYQTFTAVEAAACLTLACLWHQSAFGALLGLLVAQGLQRQEAVAVCWLLGLLRLARTAVTEEAVAVVVAVVLGLPELAATAL